jgi:hypothetical protein
LKFTSELDLVAQELLFEALRYAPQLRPHIRTDNTQPGLRSLAKANATAASFAGEPDDYPVRVIRLSDGCP